MDLLLLLFRTATHITRITIVKLVPTDSWFLLNVTNNTLLLPNVILTVNSTSTLVWTVKKTASREQLFLIVIILRSLLSLTVPIMTSCYRDVRLVLLSLDFLMIDLNVLLSLLIVTIMTLIKKLVLYVTMASV